MDLGISLDLAQARTARVSALKYAVHLEVPADVQQRVRGHLTATFVLSDATIPLAFDFAQAADHLDRLVANGAALAPQTDQGHILLPPAHLRRGSNVVSFDFVAGEEALHRQDEFLYSLLVPARASTVMPCFDQPDLKARWTVTLDIPHGWTAVSNGRETGRSMSPDHISLRFEETEPISTYLFAIAAGKFAVEKAERGGRTLRMFHREADQATVTRNREALMDLHAHALAWLEDYTEIPFPFGKFDFILIPSFQFSGMEHPGAIYYNASTLMLDGTATQQQLLARASVIAHETAHMWFGNLVTMRWFNDVWMKEVFANFMAAKIVGPSFPDLHQDLQFLWQHYPAAYDVDRTQGAHPIHQPLDNLNEAGTLYGAIIYQKAPIVMRQLERLIGAGHLQQGLREYLRTYSMGNATWPDLINVLDRESAIDLRAWSRAWVDEPGRPTVTTDLQIADGRISRLTFRQTDRHGRPSHWPQQLEVVVGSYRGVHTLAVDLLGPDVTVPAAVGLAADWVLPAGHGLGYARFDLDPGTLAVVAGSLQHLPDAMTRGAALLVLWESMLEGQVSPDRVWRQLVAALAVETDELNVQQLIDYARTLFWRVMIPDRRPAAAAEIEPVLGSGLAQAGTTGAKAMWFSGLRSLATSPSAIDWLTKIWRRETSVAGLPLSESDDIELALALAVRDVPTADRILRTELDRIENPDSKARFTFLVPALSGNGAVRDRFFDSLSDPSNRRREAWVVEALRYLHHPLRVGTSRKYVRAALEFVRELQRTGDIFFPKRWADATLAGHQSLQTATEVRSFIDGLSADYPVRLRWALMASADLLFRHLDGKFAGPSSPESGPDAPR